MFLYIETKHYLCLSFNNLKFLIMANFNNEFTFPLEGNMIVTATTVVTDDNGDFKVEQLFWEHPKHGRLDISDLLDIAAISDRCYCNIENPDNIDYLKRMEERERQYHHP